MRGFGKRVLMAALLAAVLPAAATDVAARPGAASHAVTLQTVTVTGVQPGPGLWKVSRGGQEFRPDPGR